MMPSPSKTIARSRSGSRHAQAISRIAKFDQIFQILLLSDQGSYDQVDFDVAYQTSPKWTKFVHQTSPKSTYTVYVNVRVFCWLRAHRYVHWCWCSTMPIHIHTFTHISYLYARETKHAFCYFILNRRHFKFDHSPVCWLFAISRHSILINRHIATNQSSHMRTSCNRMCYYK